MPIVELTEIWNGRDGGINESGVRRYKRIFRVRMSNYSADVLEATATASIPGLGTIYQAPNGAVDLGATCRDVDGQQDIDNPHIWFITCTFSNERTQQRMSDNPLSFGNFGGGTTTGNPAETNPLLRAPMVRWGIGQGPNRALEYVPIANGAPVLSTNGQRFDPPVEVEDHYQVLIIERNMASNQQAKVETHVNRRNDGNITIAGQVFLDRTGLLKAIESESQVEQNNFFYKVRYTIWRDVRRNKANTDWLGWDEEVLATGTRKKNGEPFFDTKSALPISSPVPLDANGDRLDLTVGSPAYHYIRFSKYPVVEWASLALPA